MGEWETRNPKSEIRTGAKQLAPPTLAGEFAEGKSESEIRNRDPKSEIRSPKSEIRNRNPNRSEAACPAHFGGGVTEGKSEIRTEAKQLAPPTLAGEFTEGKSANQLIC
jgi:hypothetical protein